MKWNYKHILDYIRQTYTGLEKIPDPAHSTSANHQIPGFKGTVGVIAAYSRTFCGSCNRMRITPQGMLKTCLYDDGVFNVRNLMRHGATDAELQTAFLEALGDRAKNGFEAEQRRAYDRPANESMSTIGG